MDRKEKIDHLSCYFPKIREIRDEKIAEAVADVWLEMLRISVWEDISQARFKEGYDQVSLVSHVNSTVECALAVSRIIKKHHGINFDEQKLITYGLLHDVDKMVEYVFNENGELVVSEMGKKIQHGVMSAILAYNAGFNTDMLHLILTHTTSSSMKTEDKEGILYGYVDLCDWELTCKFTQR